MSKKNQMASVKEGNQKDSLHQGLRVHWKRTGAQTGECQDGKQAGVEQQRQVTQVGSWGQWDPGGSVSFQENGTASRDLRGLYS